MSGSCANLALAGWRFEFKDVDDSPLRFHSAFSPFLDAPTALPLAASYRIVHPDSTLGVEDWPRRPVWTTETWRLEQSPNGDWIFSIHILPNESPLPVARFSPDFRSGDLLRRAGRNGSATPYAFNYPCDQIAVVNVLNEQGVGVIHASAVWDACGILLFCGRSGAGKTTLSRLFRASGALLLNDDRQFVWTVDSRVEAMPTPWHGSEPEINVRRGPIVAIFHLEHAPFNRATQLDPIESVTRLLGNTIAPFYRADAVERALAWAESVATRVPSYRLEFEPSTRAVDLCRSVAEKTAKWETPQSP